MKERREDVTLHVSHHYRHGRKCTECVILYVIYSIFSGCLVFNDIELIYDFWTVYYTT